MQCNSYSTLKITNHCPIPSLRREGLAGSLRNMTSTQDTAQMRALQRSHLSGIMATAPELLAGLIYNLHRISAENPMQIQLVKVIPETAK